MSERGVKLPRVVEIPWETPELDSLVEKLLKERESDMDFPKISSTPRKEISVLWKMWTEALITSQQSASTEPEQPPSSEPMRSKS